LKKILLFFMKTKVLLLPVLLPTPKI